LKAYTQQWFSISNPSDIAATALDEALISAQKAVELEPNLREGYAALGWVKLSKRDWIEAEVSFRKALGLTTEPLSANAMFFIANYYQSVGFFKKAHEMLLEVRSKDPLSQDARQQYIFNLAFQNDRHGAEEEYEAGMALLGDNWKMGGYGHITMVRLGSGDILSSDEIIRSDRIDDIAKQNLQSPKEGLEALRLIIKNDDNLSSDDFGQISLWGAYFGDPGFAMDTMEKSVRASGLSMFFFWFPVMHEVRQTPSFKKFVKEIGLVDYWNKFGWPDTCHKLDNGDFVCE
jgi:tetratricopeptide (TPR) repeat protein